MLPFFLVNYLIPPILFEKYLLGWPLRNSGTKNNAQPTDSLVVREFPFHCSFAGS